jgi:hypothetical protein
MKLAVLKPSSGVACKYSGTSVHERLSSRTNRFTNKFSEQKNVSGVERCLE